MHTEQTSTNAMLTHIIASVLTIVATLPEVLFAAVQQATPSRTMATHAQVLHTLPNSDGCYLCKGMCPPLQISMSVTVVMTASVLSTATTVLVATPAAVPQDINFRVTCMLAQVHIVQKHDAVKVQ